MSIPVVTVSVSFNRVITMSSDPIHIPDSPSSVSSLKDSSVLSSDSEFNETYTHTSETVSDSETSVVESCDICDEQKSKPALEEAVGGVVKPRGSGPSPGGQKLETVLEESSGNLSTSADDSVHSKSSTSEVNAGHHLEVVMMEPRNESSNTVELLCYRTVNYVEDSTANVVADPGDDSSLIVADTPALTSTDDSQQPGTSSSPRCSPPRASWLPKRPSDAQVSQVVINAYKRVKFNSRPIIELIEPTPPDEPPRRARIIRAAPRGIKLTVPEKLFKVIIVGDSTVGKTSFIQRYVMKSFHVDYKGTVGVDFSIKIIKLEDMTVRLQLWDIAGQERYTWLSRVYFKDAHGCIIMFDLTNKRSFLNTIKWKEEVDKKCLLHDGSPIPCMLLANKCDLKYRRQVEQMEIELFFKEFNFIGWTETSSKEGLMVEDAMSFLLNSLLKQEDNSSSSEDISTGIVPLSGPEERKRSSCSC